MTELWVETLATECKRTSQVRAALLLGVSGSLVNQVLKGSYKGDMNRIKALVEGALMGQMVACPVLGELKQNLCLEHQAREFASTNQTRVRLYRACRDGCPHSRINGKDGG